MLSLLRSSQIVFRSGRPTLQSHQSCWGPHCFRLPVSRYSLGLGAPKWTLQSVTRTCHWSPRPGIPKATERTPYCSGRPTTLSLLRYMRLVSHYPLHSAESTLTRTVDLFFFLNSFSLCKIISANQSYPYTAHNWPWVQGPAWFQPSLHRTLQWRGTAHHISVLPFSPPDTHPWEWPADKMFWN